MALEVSAFVAGPPGGRRYRADSLASHLRRSVDLWRERDAAIADSKVKCQRK